MDEYNAYKNRIGISVSKRLEEGIKNGAITEEEASKIATFILENIDKTKNTLEIVNFLEVLSQRWPVFQQVLTIEQGEIVAHNDERAAEQATELLKRNNIDAALKVVDAANNFQQGGTPQ